MEEDESNQLIGQPNRNHRAQSEREPDRANQGNGERDKRRYARDDNTAAETGET
jgi:hypothetical protein